VFPDPGAEDSSVNAFGSGTMLQFATRCFSTAQALGRQFEVNARAGSSGKREEFCRWEGTPAKAAARAAPPRAPGDLRASADPRRGAQIRRGGQNEKRKPDAGQADESGYEWTAAARYSGCKRAQGAAAARPGVVVAAGQKQTSRSKLRRRDQATTRSASTLRMYANRPCFARGAMLFICAVPLWINLSQYLFAHVINCFNLNRHLQ
jgi:hypothetical protein